MDFLELVVPAHQLAGVEDVEQWLQHHFKNADLRIKKCSLDARKNPPKYRIRYYNQKQATEATSKPYALQKINSHAPRVLIVGFGPAGMFAALQCIELGIKPVVIEQGKNVKERRRDLAQITKNHLVNPYSNYCFGEGGAGTYSDGKLYTRSKKRGDVLRIFETLVAYGAPREILYQAHPHIGTNKLPGIVEAMREAILDSGGDIHFNTRFTGLVTERNKVVGITTDQGTFHAPAVILAPGHSATDVYQYLVEQKLTITPKAFAVGFRIEHNQSFVNQCQYHGNTEGLPPAAYSLVHNVKERGVFSFCMCPGGIVAPCATAPNQIVTNGWSPSKRNNPFANAGIVTQVFPEDMEKYGFQGPLAGMEFQRSIEEKASQWAKGTQQAPAQQAQDFIAKRKSNNVGASSYLPGIFPANFWDLYPNDICQRLAEGLRAFEKKMGGFLRENPVLIGPETRTSAPVRIPRLEDCQHPDLHGLFPCGEGAGYAGGIASAAMDGVRCAQQAAKVLR